MQRYSYNMPWRGVIAFVVFNLGLAFFIGHLAAGYVGIIYGGLISLSGMFAVLALILPLRRWLFPHTLELTDDAVLFPPGFSRRRITCFRYADTIRMSWTRTGLYLVGPEGGFEVTHLRFKDADSCQAAINFIRARIPIALPAYDAKAPMDFLSGGVPEPLLAWREPEEWPRFRTHLVTSRPFSARLAKSAWFYLRCFCIILLPWLLLQAFQQPTAPAPGFLILATLTSLFFTAIHWMNTTYPAYASKICLRANGVTCLFGRQWVDWNYSHFSGWKILERRFDERKFFILLLQSPSRVNLFAIPDAEIRDQVIQILTDKLIPQNQEIVPPAGQGL